MNPLIFLLPLFVGIHASINLHGKKVEGRILYPKTFPEYVPSGSCLHVSLLDVSVQDVAAPAIAHRVYYTVTKHSTKKYTLHFPRNDFPDSTVFSVGAVLNIGHCSSSSGPTVGKHDYISDTQNTISRESIDESTGNKIEGPEVYLTNVDIVKTNETTCPPQCPLPCPDTGCPENCCVPIDQPNYQLSSQQVCPVTCPTVAPTLQPTPCPVCTNPPCPPCTTLPPCPVCTTPPCPACPTPPACPGSCSVQCTPNCPTQCCQTPMAG